MNVMDYEKLGLKPDASIEDVKKRYDILMRRSIHDETVNIDPITAAYDRIISEDKIDYFNSDAELLNEKGFNKKKLKNFIFQRKIMIGIIIWAIIGLILLIYMLVDPQAGYNTPDIAPF